MCSLKGWFKKEIMKADITETDKNDNTFFLGGGGSLLGFKVLKKDTLHTF